MMYRGVPFWQDRRRRIWILVAVLVVVAVLIALALFAIGQAHQQAGSNDTGPRSFGVRPNALLVIKEQSGDISVVPGDGGSISVKPRKHGTILSPEPSQVHIVYTQGLTAQGNDQLTVTTDPWISNTDFYISIPSTTAVQIALNSGSIDVHTGNGLNATTGSGRLILENINGPVTAHTDSGDVTATKLSGPVSIGSSSGSLRMQQIKGQLTAQTWSGDVTGRDMQLSGNSLLQTQNGSVRFAGSLDPHGTYKMNTTSGDVDLTLPGDTAFTLEASTGSGSVQNAFATTETGKVPRAQLSLHTQNGSIAVVKSS